MCVQVDKPNACKVPPKRANSPASKDDDDDSYPFPFPLPFRIPHSTCHSHSRSHSHSRVAIPVAFCVTFNHKMAFSCQRLPQQQQLRQLPEACHAHQLRFASICTSTGVVHSSSSSLPRLLHLHLLYAPQGTTKQPNNKSNEQTNTKTERQLRSGLHMAWETTDTLARWSWMRL